MYQILLRHKLKSIWVFKVNLHLWNYELAMLQTEATTSCVQSTCCIISVVCESVQPNCLDRPIYKAANIIGKMFALIRGLLLLHCLPGTMWSHNFVWCAYFHLELHIWEISPGTRQPLQLTLVKQWKDQQKCFEGVLQKHSGNHLPILMDVALICCAVYLKFVLCRQSPTWQLRTNTWYLTLFNTNIISIAVTVCVIQPHAEHVYMVFWATGQ